MLRLLPCMLLLAATHASAATLNLCPGKAAPAGARSLDSVLRPTGETLQLMLHKDGIAGCETITLEHQPRWARLLDRSSAQRFTGGLMLQTARGESRSTAPQDVIQQDVIQLDTRPQGNEASGPALMLPGSELLPLLQIGRAHV